MKNQDHASDRAEECGPVHHWLDPKQIKCRCGKLTTVPFFAQTPPQRPSVQETARLEGRIAQIEAELQGGAPTLDELKAELAALQSAVLGSPETPPQTYENVWIVAEYHGGGIRGVFVSQVDAEAEIAAIRAEHGDLTRSDFVIGIHRVRREKSAQPSAIAATPTSSEGPNLSALPPQKCEHELQKWPKGKCMKCGKFPKIAPAETPQEDAAPPVDVLRAISDEFEVFGACPHQGENGGLCKECSSHVLAASQPSVLAVPDGRKDRYRYERPAMKIVEAVKEHLLPAMEEEEGGWLLGEILDLAEKIQKDADADR